MSIEATTARVRSIMEELLNAITVNTVNRGKSATGRFVNSLRSSVLSGQTFVIAEGRATAHWKYVGNGRGPGKMPPVSRLQPWVRAKGLPPGAAFAIARKIGKEGTEDYKAKRENVVAETVQRFVRDGKFNLGPELSKGVKEQVLENFTQLKAA